MRVKGWEKAGYSVIKSYYGKPYDLQTSNCGHLLDDMHEAVQGTRAMPDLDLSSWDAITASIQDLGNEDIPALMESLCGAPVAPLQARRFDFACRPGDGVHPTCLGVVDHDMVLCVHDQGGLRAYPLRRFDLIFRNG